jgi:hypothetical protein
MFLEIKKPKRITKRINPLTEEATILGAIALFGSLVIGIIIYYLMLLPFTK